MKDALGHGSEGHGGSAGGLRRAFQNIYGRVSDHAAANAMASGPKSNPVPIHMSFQDRAQEAAIAHRRDVSFASNDWSY